MISFNRQLLYALLVIIPLLILIYGYEQHRKEVPALQKKMMDRKKQAQSKFSKLPKKTKGNPFTPETIEQATGRVLRHVRPCVVNITSFNSKPVQYRGDTFGKILGPYQAGNILVSSGILVSSTGDIITSYDAVPTNKIEVKLFRRKPNTFKARIVKVDKALQLAHLKLTGNVTQLPHCHLGDSDVVRVGDFVYAIGSPYGFSQTITAGIVSSNRKHINIQGDVFKKMIQTDAAINKGNNGGPLVDVDGKVVGVNMATFTTSSGSTGIGFAVPVNDVKAMVDGAVTIR